MSDIKTFRSALFTLSERPIFKHELCGFIYDPNIDLKEYSGKLVTITNPNCMHEYTTCNNCGAIYLTEEKYKPYSILVEFTSKDEGPNLFPVCESELTMLEGYYDL